MDRRDFIKTGAVAASGLLLSQSGLAQLNPVKRIAVRLLAPESMKTRLAVRELCNGLHTLNGVWEVAETKDDAKGKPGGVPPLWDGHAAKRIVEILLKVVPRAKAS